MSINSASIHPTVKEAAEVFARAGKQVYLVGGAVRDLIRGRRAMDWDLATDARPEEVIRLFGRALRPEEQLPPEPAAGEGSPPPSGKEPRAKKPGSFVVPTGIKHGTVTVHFGGLSMEVTTFRSESSYSDGRRPDKVEFGVSIEKDLSRRDFTMNAAAYKLPSGPFVDPFDGKGDIKKRLIRTVGSPEERFSEDGLRPVRALRFASQLDFSVDEALLAAIPAAIPFTAKVAAERIRDELDKILCSQRPSAALRLAEKTGLLRLLIPELAACRGISQDRGEQVHFDEEGFFDEARAGNGTGGGSGKSRGRIRGLHRFDVLDHSLLACDFAAKEGGDRSLWKEKGQSDEAAQLARRLAALFHDIGKPLAARVSPEGERTFYRHEKESAVLTRTIMLRFRYPNALTDRVCHLVEEHMFHYDESWTDAAVRRFIVRAGEENLEDLYALRRADAFGTAAEPPPPDLLLPLQRRVEEILAQSRALSLKDLAIGGGDLMEMGIRPGKIMGIILSELLEAVLDDPALNTKEKLREIAEKIGARYK